MPVACSPSGAPLQNSHACTPSEVGTHPDVILDVARTTTKKQIRPNYLDKTHAHSDILLMIMADFGVYHGIISLRSSVCWYNAPSRLTSEQLTNTLLPRFDLIDRDRVFLVRLARGLTLCLS